MRHPSSDIQVQNILRVDQITISVFVDMGRSAKAPTPEVAEERMRKHVTGLLDDLASQLHSWLGTIPEGVVVEVHLE